LTFGVLLFLFARRRGVPHRLVHRVAVDGARIALCADPPRLPQLAGHTLLVSTLIAQASPRSAVCPLQLPVWSSCCCWRRRRFDHGALRPGH
jgi:hypothetical protein